MGQAALDLPDPLEQPRTSAAGTDDLLAQLAGEEIDRLLAQSESDEAAAAKPADPLEAVTPLLAPLEVQEAVAKTQEPTPAVQLDNYLGKLSADEAKEPVAAALPVHPASPVPELSAHVVVPVPSITDEDEEHAAERGALHAIDPSPVPQSPGPSLSSMITKVDRPPRPGVAIRFLTLLNAPLNSCSDDVRELLGKIAILTSVNAISILVYVLFFRKHH